VLLILIVVYQVILEIKIIKHQAQTNVLNLVMKGNSTTLVMEMYTYGLILTPQKMLQIIYNHHLCWY
jgi:hypothetical protein